MAKHPALLKCGADHFTDLSRLSVSCSCTHRKHLALFFLGIRQKESDLGPKQCLCVNVSKTVSLGFWGRQEMHVASITVGYLMGGSLFRRGN